MSTESSNCQSTGQTSSCRRCLIDKEIGRLPVVEEDVLEGILTAKDVCHGYDII